MLGYKKERQGKQDVLSEACSYMRVGEDCLTNICGLRVGRVFMRLFFFFYKKENSERLKKYILYLNFYK